MTARISGRRDDEIKIYQKAHLKGEAARGALKTHIAVRDRALADIYHTLIASAPFARGLVNCRQFVCDRAVASVVPIVEVHHPLAHVTHDASLGSIGAGQLEALMCRGLTREEAADRIIEGLLGPAESAGPPAS
jgi:Fe-S cluster assembly scaffold protein SufB